MLKIIDLSKSYGKEDSKQEVLKKIDLFLPEKGFISILGKSGSGKTTLLNLLGGLDKFEEGEILYYNQKYSEITSEQWDLMRSNVISFVFQEDNLIDSFSIIENLRFVLPNEPDEIIIDTLKKFDLESKINKMPHQLSGGEKQRIAIVRSLLKESKIILVDEPTGNLDDENSKIVLELLKELSKEKLVFMITHDKEFAELYSDEIIEIKDGVIKQTNNNIKKSEIIETTNDKVLRLRSKQTIALVLGQMKKKWLKLTQYAMLLTITLFLLGMGFSLLFTNEYSIASKTFINNNTEFYFIETLEHEYYDEDDLNHFKQLLDDNAYKYYANQEIRIKDENGLAFNSINYLPFISGFMTYNDRVNIIFGTEPINSDETVVSDFFVYSLIINNLLDIEEIEDSIGLMIPQTDMIISGIYDTNYESFSEYLDYDEYFFYNDSFDRSIVSELKYRIREYYSNSYVSEQFDYSRTRIQLDSILPGEGYLLESISPIRIISYDDVSSFSEDLLDVNDVYISRHLLYKILNESSSYNFTSYESFIANWVENEESITNYILDQEITVQLALETQKYHDSGYSFYIDGDVFTIKGIIVDDMPTNDIFINDDLYSEFFEKYFSIIVYVEDSSLVNEKNVRLIRENGYYYVASLTDSIISYIDEQGPILRLLAFSISGLFSVFTVLLFSNLLSRDIIAMKKEIGLFRSLGIKMRDISKLFTYEIIILSFVSLVLALLFEPLGIKLLNRITSQDAKVLSIVTYDIRMVLSLVIVTVVFSLISVILPLKRLNKMEIVDCIKVKD